MLSCRLSRSIASAEHEVGRRVGSTEETFFLPFLPSLLPEMDGDAVFEGVADTDLHARARPAAGRARRVHLLVMNVYHGKMLRRAPIFACADDKKGRGELEEQEIAGKRRQLTEVRKEGCEFPSRKCLLFLVGNSWSCRWSTLCKSTGDVWVNNNVGDNSMDQCGASAPMRRRSRCGQCIKANAVHDVLALLCGLRERRKREKKKKRKGENKKETVPAQWRSSTASAVVARVDRVDFVERYARHVRTH